MGKENRGGRRGGMSEPVLVALISAGGSVLIAVTALILNYRGFAAIDARFTSLEARVQNFETRVDSRLNLLQADMRDLNKTMGALEVDVALLKDKAGL
jgi:predicted component of type VI protein secretion system